MIACRAHNEKNESGQFDIKCHTIILIQQGKFTQVVNCDYR